MANVATPSVPLGREGTGTAVILGSGLGPLTHYVANRRFQEQMANMRLRYLDQLNDDRDRRISKIFDYTPENGWEPFQRQVLDRANNDVYKWAKDQLNQGRKIDYSFYTDLRQRENDVDLIAQQSKAYKDQYTKSYDHLKRNEKYLEFKYYNRKLNDIFFEQGSDIKGRPIDEVDPKMASAIFSDATGYKMNNVMVDFVKNLPTQVLQQYDELAASIPGGIYFNRDKLKGKLFAVGPDGNLLLDKEGNFIVKVTPEVISRALNDEYIRNYVDLQRQQEASRGGTPRSEAEIVTELMRPYAYVETTETPSGITKPSDAGEINWSMGLGDPEVRRIVTDMNNKLESMINAYTDGNGNRKPSNEVNIDALEAAGELGSAKFHGSPILGHDFVPKGQPYGKLVYDITTGKQNQQIDPDHDKIVFKVKGLKAGRIEYYSLDLDSPSTYKELYNILMTMPGANKKLTIDLMDQIRRQHDPLGLLKGESDVIQEGQKGKSTDLDYIREQLEKK